MDSAFNTPGLQGASRLGGTDQDPTLQQMGGDSAGNNTMNGEMSLTHMFLQD